MATAEDQAWLDEHVASEDAPENRIAVELEPQRWHTKLIPVRKQLLKKAASWNDAKRAADAANVRRANESRPGPNWEALAFSSQFDPGGLLGDKQGAKVFRVSELTLNRALAIANALFYAAQSRGCKVAIDDERITIQLEEARFSISIRERQLRTEPPSDSRMPGQDIRKGPRSTDKLALVVDKIPGSKFEIVDDSERRVESQLNIVFVRLYGTVVAAREQSRRMKIEGAQREIARAEAQAIASQRAAEAKALADEMTRREELAGEAAAWNQAQQIRAYATHIFTALGTEKAATWNQWATCVADDIDPTTARIGALSADSKAPQ